MRPNVVPVCVFMCLRLLMQECGKLFLIMNGRRLSVGWLQSTGLESRQLSVAEMRPYWYVHIGRCCCSARHLKLDNNLKSELLHTEWVCYSLRRKVFAVADDDNKLVAVPELQSMVLLTVFFRSRSGQSWPPHGCDLHCVKMHSALSEILRPRVSTWWSATVHAARPALHDDGNFGIGGMLRQCLAVGCRWGLCELVGDLGRMRWHRSWRMWRLAWRGAPD